MNKRFLLISLGVLSIATAMQARSRSAEEAKQVAAEFYQSQNGLRSASDVEFTLVYSGSENELRASTGEAPFYVFNIGSADGFVMVSGDDRVAPVIGYSLTSAFNPDNMPSNLRGWLEGYEKQIEYARTLPDKPYVKPETRAGEFPEQVEPLITTQWDQSAPYNNECPEINGEKAVTGCVATAAAQIMNYHKWPASATGTGYFVLNGSTDTTEVEMAQYTFDWDNMINDYKNNNGTEAQKKAVAKLMAACGAAAKMNYGLIESGAGTANIATGLIENFDYDSNISYVLRDIYTTDEWISIIKAELAAKRPVLYDGSKMEGAGHAFICDGYNADDYFHFNWGWSGYSDEYYLLDLLYFDEVSNVPNLGYSIGQGAIIGIQKSGSETTVEKKEELVIRTFDLEELEIERNGELNFSLALQWMSSTPEIIYPYMEFRKGDEAEFILGLGECNYYNAASLWYNWTKPISLENLTIPEGDYDIVFTYQREGDEKLYEAVYSKAAIHTDWKVTVTETKMIWKPVSAELTGSITGLQVWVDGLGNQIISAQTTLRNESLFEISPVIGYHLYSTDDAEIDEYFFDEGQVYLAPQDETTVELFFPYELKPGRYVIEAIQGNDFYGYLIEGTTYAFQLNDPTANETISANDFSIRVYTDRIAVQSASTVRQIELYDISGRLAGSIRGANELPVDGLADGVYIVRVTTNEGVQTEKVILHR